MTSKSGDERGVGAVVVHYFREADLEGMMVNLIERHKIRPQDLVVVNNGGSAELLTNPRKIVPEENWIDLDNPGYGAAVNAGAACLQDKVDYLLVVTHDVTVADGTIATLVSHLHATPTTGLVGPQLDDSRDGSVWSTGGLQPAPFFRPANRKTLVSTAESTLEADWLDGACFMIRSDDFKLLGGLEESYFLYFEDVDLGWRVRSILGKRVRCIQTARASQAPGGNLDQYLAARNLQWLLARQGHHWARTLFVLELIVRLVVGTIGKPVGAKERQKKRIRGLIAGLRPACRDVEIVGRNA
ncbi:MAG: hypothetical protein CMH38_15045 [Microbacterium sp.]|uniref:glycosyltransferase n=1 Tax=unclassified Microbacterium TaxID=2609290 RepID=UPI000C379762|nr:MULTISPECIES: glycosyltransferase family 2 protein [unclassified Microbacterium]MAY51202.1 hypothetical protein [Microbacterium sp.]